MSQKMTKQQLFKQRFGKQINDYSSFKRAIEGLKKSTIIGYRDVLVSFFMYLDEDPDTVIANRQEDIRSPNILEGERYERKVKQYKIMLEEKNLDAKTMVNRIQGFFTNNSKRLSLDLKKLDFVSGSKHVIYSPTCDEVKKLLTQAGTARNKFIIMALFHNGILPVDLAALKIGDYPTEPWVYYKKIRSKTKKFWYSASTPEACKFLNEYLQIRNGKTGEPLLLGREGPLGPTGIKIILDQLIKQAGLDKNPNFIPKCLRNGFFNSLREAKVDVQTREAFMGHTSNISHVYCSEKELAEAIIESMRKAYPFMSLFDDELSSGDRVDNAVLQKLLSVVENLEARMKKQEEEIVQLRNRSAV